jgi:hypothetical protein
MLMPSYLDDLKLPKDQDKDKWKCFVKVVGDIRLSGVHVPYVAVEGMREDPHPQQLCRCMASRVLHDGLPSISHPLEPEGETGTVYGI